VPRIEGQAPTVAGAGASDPGAGALHALLDQAGELLAVVGTDGRLAYCNGAGTRMLGLGPGTLVGHPLAEVVHPDDVDRMGGWADGGPRPGPMLVLRMRHADRTWRTVEATFGALSTDAGFAGVTLTARDVTDRLVDEADRSAEHGLMRLSEERYRGMVEGSPHATAVHQKGVFVYANAACAALLGYMEPVDLIGMSVLSLVHADDLDLVKERVRAAYETGAAPQREIRLVRLDGKVLTLETTATRVMHDGSPAIQLMARDLTDRKTMEGELAHQSLHDQLTGLPNRTLLLDRLHQAIARTSRTGTRVAVLFLDLDHFKVINDSLGHDAGDRLLLEVSRSLTDVLRKADTLARFGGDEFVVVVEGVADLNGVTALAERIAVALDRPMVEGDQAVTIKTSIGIAISSDDNESADDLIRDADMAMYRAKDRGRGRYEVFDAAMRASARDRLHDEFRLRKALDHGELRVYYQPLVAVEDCSVIGMEALLRWQDPDRGLVLPMDIIPLAEESGLIVPIGEWVFREAHAQAGRWHARFGRSLEVAVNLSARQLTEPNLVATIADLIDNGGLGSDDVRVVLEITESLSMEDPAATATILAELKALGIGLAIDDFGTGYSSLAHLRKFPVDTLKIDRSFISGLDGDRDNRAIVTAIIELGHALELSVLAEGVETEAELEVLRELQCDRAQGYWFGRPQPADEATLTIQRSIAALESVPGPV
jgi:diguanylate cyclase (GGDEF)-like protein/PAS domain S-box-containing protein